ncbi:MAG: tRNA (N6-isopentenyl adenosine(37)-C2)-methylthiotransferase MiaB [Planctomycetota bacterium]|jgi:tRNA-2-methylthio-N6-dimethylallyladenosine synthase
MLYLEPSVDILGFSMACKKIHIKSFGCQMNKLDTALVRTALQKEGFAFTDSAETSDVVLINTCSVREHAEEKVFSHLGSLKHIKKTRSDLVVGIIGCMAQRLGNELLEHEAVDIVCGPNQIPQITRLIKEAIENKHKSLAVTDEIRKVSGENPELEDFESVYDNENKQIPGQAYVRVMRGCNNFCSYCIVPYVRGPEVSRPPGKIIEQVKRLAGEGIKQVTLLGQAVNLYDYNSGEKTYTLADILEMVNEIDGIEWIRFLTSYPTEKNFEPILQAMVELPKVCSYLHMPAQSGSDKILKAMNRKYTSGQYLELIERARSIVTDIAVAGDFIVGFPGETDEDFQATVELVEKSLYKNCYVFKYSPRPGTTGQQKLEDNVSLEIKKKRNIELLAVQEKVSDELSKNFLGKTVTVLVEGLSKKPHLNQKENDDNPQLIGRTATDWIVVFNGPSMLAGEFAKIKITKTSPLTLFGEISNSSGVN